VPVDQRATVTDAMHDAIRLVDLQPDIVDTVFKGV
jgi:hypothetical protein